MRNLKENPNFFLPYKENACVTKFQKHKIFHMTYALCEPSHMKLFVWRIDLKSIKVYLQKKLVLKHFHWTHFAFHRRKSSDLLFLNLAINPLIDNSDVADVSTWLFEGCKNKKLLGRDFYATLFIISMFPFILSFLLLFIDIAFTLHLASTPSAVMWFHKSSNVFLMMKERRGSSQLVSTYCNHESRAREMARIPAISQVICPSECWQWGWPGVLQALT